MANGTLKPSAARCAKRLQQLLKAADMTTAQLAAKSGVPEASILKVEQGGTLYCPELRAVAKALGTTREKMPECPCERTPAISAGIHNLFARRWGSRGGIGGRG
jgi:transcriptional regulator with XRE-family HTH domain